MAIALRNRWRRMSVIDDIRREIIPNNILMIGPTGVGKTEIARRLAKLANAPFVKVEASKFTEVGYVGRDVESMVRDLAERSAQIVKDQKKAEIKKKVVQIVEDIILDGLIPPIKGIDPQTNTAEKPTYASAEHELNEKTRHHFRLKIRNGELEDKKIEIVVEAANTSMGVVGGALDEVSMMNIQEMISGMMPRKSKRRKVAIREARKILMEEQSAKLIDMDEVKSLAIAKAENTGIIFIDEIDKVAVSSAAGRGPDVSREGVQRDLLPIVEGSSVNTKYGILKTDHVLFIAAGAFHMAKPSDLIPELQGRFPIRVELDSLTKDDFYHILKTPKNALIKQYIALLATEGVKLSFNDDTLKELAHLAYQINSEIENIGARRLHTVMSALLNELLFDVPDKIGANAHIVVTNKMVNDRLAKLVKNKDLSQYVL